MQGAEGDFAVIARADYDRCRPAEVEMAAIPQIGFDDAPAAREDLGEGGNSGHQPVSAMSLGSRTRL